MFKKTLVLSGLLIAGGFVSQSALADLSANVGVTSNYVWRGQTQTNNGSAIQGGLDYSNASGLSVGTWVSNTAFGSQELDLYGAYDGTVGDFGYTLGVIQYRYPQISNANWNEVALGGSYKNYSLKYSHTSSYGGNSGSKADYIEAAASFNVAKDLSLDLHIGHQKFDKPTVSLPSYTDYSASLSKDDFSFTISKTDLPSTNTDSKVKVYVGWTKSFTL